MQKDMPEFGTGTGTADFLWPAAVARVDRLRGQDKEILPYPVPHPQRGFRTGHSRTCALVEALEQERHRTTGFAGDGIRYARLRAGDAA